MKRTADYCVRGGILTKQPAASRSLELTLLRARELAEELGEDVVSYFIDMAILEARAKNRPTVNDYKAQPRK
jgi:hypothetical protein